MNDGTAILIVVVFLASLVLAELIDNVLGGPARREAARRSRYHAEDWTPWWTDPR